MQQQDDQRSLGTSGGGVVRADVGLEGLAEAVYHGALDPVLVLTNDGVVLRANDAAKDAFGPDVVGTHFGIPPEPGTTSEIELHTATGPRTAEMRTGTAVAGGEKVRVVNLRDVTERKSVEQALRDFVSTASHEFRTPLFAIAGFAETLETQWDQLEDGEKQRYIQVMHRQARRLSRLTDDLLTVARLDGEGLETTSTTVVLAAAVDRALTLLDDVEVEADVPDGLQARVDPDHLEDVLINLLTNADKYGEPPFEIVAEGDDGEVVVRVIDHGEGVPSAFRARLFERFARERRAARENPGTGLGLAIAHGLMERNGGELRYEETPGGGATFVIRLPRP